MVDILKYVTPVKNQGFCSCCIAYAAISAVEILVNIKTQTKKNSPLSEKNLFYNSPGFSNKKILGVHNCRVGWNIEEALHFLQHSGASDSVKIA